MQRRRVPAVVIGSGAAGLACALALAETGTPCLVISKTPAAAGGSSLLSQGGIAAALGVDDSPTRHGDDTVRAGAGLADVRRVAGLVRDGVDAMTDLLAAGFPADRGAGGELALGREGAHSTARIVHAGGDRTGEALVATLLENVARTPSIEVMAGTVAVDLVVAYGRVAGVLTHNENDGWLLLESAAVVLATGGTGALWAVTTNPAEATGDGVALAARAGATLGDLEFMQFHPTALDAGMAGGTRAPLLTEALRGAGARLVDGKGVAFMADEHSLGDLAPRDQVARAIWRRRAAGERVGLDLGPVLATAGAGAFPTAVAACRAAGLDPFAAPVPVTPAAHYHMGGVVADAAGRTTVAGLWACGEAANTGVHGANRLASNSLLEALVWARRVAADIAAVALPLRVPRAAVPPIAGTDGIAEAVRETMARYVGIVRDGAGLATAAGVLDDLSAGRRASTTAGNVRRWSDARNMVLAARLITLAALRRAESRGAHYRQDFPSQRREWARSQVLISEDLDRRRGVDEGVCSHPW